MKNYRISFIGAGKVSGALCRQLFLSGCKIKTIVSLNEKNGLALASSCKASWASVCRFTANEDIIITAVPDDSLRTVLENIKCSDKTIVVHTAGSYGLDVFPVSLKHTGVFYPLQTFSNNRKVDFKDLPFFIEASDELSSAIMTGLAERLGARIYFSDTERRRYLHLAAVFACNFTNHMFTTAKEITDKAGLSFEVLKPLINETVSKAVELGPENSQTGPAYRFDKETIKRHNDLLSFSPELQNIYQEITQSIIKKYNPARNDQF